MYIIYIYVYICIYIYILVIYTYRLYVLYTGCPPEKYIQLDMFIFGNVSDKFKQNFHGCKNISLSYFRGIHCPD